jgi:hypothetical protein
VTGAHTACIAVIRVTSLAGTKEFAMHIHSYSAPVTADKHASPAIVGGLAGRAWAWGLVLVAASLQALPVNGDPASPISFALSTAVPGSADEPARVKHDPSAVDGRNAPQLADDSRFAFFGFLEFDWNFPGSDGVPGFGPLPDSPSRVAAADSGK